MDYEWVTGGECIVCRKPFEGMHLKSRKTCSPKCRKRLERRLKAADEATNQIMRYLGLIRASIKARDNHAKRIDDLNYIRNEINDLLHLAQDYQEMARRDMLENYARKRW
jgi:predicted nucleic acid-binding Zn ribbon protein